MMKTWLLGLGFASSFACTDASLFRAAGGGQGPLDNKLSVQSSFCTLDDAFRVLASDMQHESDTSAEELARAKYVIVFVSDGLPYPVDDPHNTRTSILQHVDDILNLTRLFRPKEIKLHTALILSPN